MSFGLPETTLAQLRACIAGFPEVRWARIYGSRALGTQEKGSDIDLAFSAEQDCSADLLEALDRLPTPYLFDVTHYESLSNPNLKSHIERVGKSIYESAAERT